MRVVNTDNFGSDYPNERFVGEEGLSERDAEELAAQLNNKHNPTGHGSRWHKVVDDDYELAPGFEP